MTHLYALAIGYVLDILIGDPPSFPHIVRGIGWLISTTEKVLRRIFPKTPSGEKFAGVVLVLIVTIIPTALTLGLLIACQIVSTYLRIAVEACICAQLLATKSLKDESMKVYEALETGTLDDARQALSMIVGRDTRELSEEEIIEATVETVAENTSDGITSPLIYLALFGAGGGILYKAINTMDSMVGYKNEKYQNFGWAAANIDDLFNYVPARLSGAFMCLAAQATKLDGKQAWAVMNRDHAKHSSPNAGFTEAATAGALGIRLGGPHKYFGQWVEKPYIGTQTRLVQRQDIVTVNNLMYATSIISFAGSVIIGYVLM